MIGEGPAQGGRQGIDGIGEVLRRARINHGYSLHALAHELKVSVPILEAVEAEDWERIPPGRERPTARQIADFLEVDLGVFPEQWRQLPGAQEAEPRDPRQEKMERLLMAGLTLGCAGLLLWLVVPGRRLGRSGPQAPVAETHAGPAPWIPTDPAGPYPVVGEVLPEAPVTEDGVLVLFRAVDGCEARITPEEGGQAPQQRSLRVSEPWRLRIKGAFSIALDNAGVVALEVAGRRIRHGRNVGEPWSGSFKATGEWLVPEDTAPKTPPTAPETDPITQELE